MKTEDVKPELSNKEIQTTWKKMNKLYTEIYPLYNHGVSKGTISDPAVISKLESALEQMEKYKQLLSNSSLNNAANGLYSAAKYVHDIVCIN